MGLSKNAEIYDPVGGSSGLLSMNTVRALPTATLLSDGKVLIAGGGDAMGAPLTDAEIYDPAGFFTLVAGITTINSAELYDPVAQAFFPAGSMSYDRGVHQSTLLFDGRVLVTGGWSISQGSMIAPAELYTP